MCRSTRSLRFPIVAFLLLGASCAGDSAPRTATITIGSDSDTTGELGHTALRVPHSPVVPTILFRSDALSRISRLEILDRFVVVLQPYDSPHLLIIDTLTRTLVGELGRNGDGPGEFRFPAEISRGIAYGELWVSDPALARLTPLVLRNDQVTIDTARILSSSVAGTGFSGRQWSTSSFLISGLVGDSRFRVVDSTGAVVRELGRWDVEDPAIAIEVRATANRELVGLAPDRMQIIGVGVMTAAVRIYDTTGQVVVEGVPPYHIIPHYRVGTGGSTPSFQPQPSTRYGYVGVTTTENRVFTVFSGRTIGAFQDGSARGRFIHIFGWDGQLQGVIELPEAVRGLAVMPDGATLYATTLDPEPAVLRIRVPASLREPTASSASGRPE